MSNKIRHSGVVDSVEKECVHVRILQTSACAGCKIAGHCNASESKEKIVDVYDAQAAHRLRVGDAVVVCASTQVAARALLLGFGIPFLLLVGVVFVASLCTDDEALMALSGLCALIPYYLLLYVLKGHIREKLAFTLEDSSLNL